MPDNLIGRVPEDWMETTLAELCSSGGGDIQTGPFGSQLHASDYVPSGIPSVMPQNIGDNVILEGGIARITPEDASRLSRYLLAPGNIVYSRRGDVERRAWVRPQQTGWLCGTGCLRVRLGSSANSRFMSYYLGHPEIRAWIVRHAIGATMPNLNTGILGAVPVVIPHLRDQVAIAEALGALDDKIAINNKMADSALCLAMAEYEMSVYSGQFSRAVSMDDCAEWLSGGTPRTSEGSYWDGDIPWISALSLKSPWIDDSDRKVSSLGAENGTRLVPKDTIIFVVRGSSLDAEFRIGLTQREVAFGQDCKALRAKDGINPAVLFVAIKSRTAEILQLVDHTGHGAGRLATDLISKVTIMLPEERHNSQASMTLRPLVEIGAAWRAENRTLQELRDALLPKLLSGEIRVREAEKVVEEVT